MKKRRRILASLLILFAFLASCSPGYNGGAKIAFIRAGQLWTIYPNGNNAYALVGNSPPVIGASWSPDHHLLFYRTLDPAFAGTTAGKHLSSDPITGMIGDLPSSLNTIGVDGGSPIPIVPSDPSARYSNAWWNTTGNRLVFRLTLTAPSDFVRWQIAQNDQPEGIALKALPASFSIPTLDENGQKAIGNSEDGLFRTSQAGDNRQILLPGRLPGHPLPASLERILRQPAHTAPLLLYATAQSPADAQQGRVQLMLYQPDGHSRTLANCTCTQFAWSADGSQVLYSNGATYTLLTLAGQKALTLTAEPGSLPYWSPDQRFLLLDGPQTLTLVELANGRVHSLLSADNATTSGSLPTSLPDSKALLQPASNSPWSTDSRNLLLLTRNRLSWQDGAKHLPTIGLYTVTVDNQGQPQSLPTQLTTGNITQASWSYQDVNTSFLR